LKKKLNGLIEKEYKITSLDELFWKAIDGTIKDEILDFKAF